MRKIKYGLWLVFLHLYVILFTGPFLWRALMSGAVSVSVFVAFTMMGLSTVWVGLMVALVIIRMCFLNR